MLFCSKSDNVKAGDQYTAVYIVRGLSLGRTDIIATAVQYGKKNITSDAREIQVRSFLLRRFSLFCAKFCIGRKICMAVILT